MPAPGYSEAAASIDPNVGLTPNDIVAQIFDHDGQTLGKPIVVEPSAKGAVTNATGTHTYFLSPPRSSNYLIGDKEGSYLPMKADS